MQIMATERARCRRQEPTTKVDGRTHPEVPASAAELIKLHRVLGELNSKPTYRSLYSPICRTSNRVRIYRHVAMRRDARVLVGKSDIP